MNIEDPHLEPALLRAITRAVKEAIGSLPACQAIEPKLVLRIGEVAKHIGLSQSTIRNLLDADGPWFDPSFPRPIRLGNGTGKRSSIGWRRVDIEAWVDSRPAILAHQLDNVPSKPKPRRRRGKGILHIPALEVDRGMMSSGQISNSKNLNGGIGGSGGHANGKPYRYGSYRGVSTDDAPWRL